MIKIVAEKGRSVVEYILSRPEEVEELPKTAKHGSTAFVIATSTVYMFDEEIKEWKEI
jgi:hypothetical protein